MVHSEFTHTTKAGKKEKGIDILNTYRSLLLLVLTNYLRYANSCLTTLVPLLCYKKFPRSVNGARLCTPRRRLTSCHWLKNSMIWTMLLMECDWARKNLAWSG